MLFHKCNINQTSCDIKVKTCLFVLLVLTIRATKLQISAPVLPRTRSEREYTNVLNIIQDCFKIKSKFAINSIYLPLQSFLKTWEIYQKYSLFLEKIKVPKN